ncbi:MAG: hypothetical protein RL491_583 [Bacteroidota bacterium]
MKTNLNKELFSETGCIDSRMLLNYRDGILKRSDMHLVEKHLVDCALCSEALEGLSNLRDDAVLNELSQHFNPQTGKSTTRTYPFRYLAMAASLTAVIALSYFAIQQSKNATVQEQALNNSPIQMDESDSTVQPLSSFKPETAPPSNTLVSSETEIKNEAKTGTNKNIVVIKDNEAYPEDIPAPTEEFKDITASGTSNNEGATLNMDENIDMNAELYTGSNDASSTSQKSLDDVSLSKQVTIRGSRTPGASAPSAASNSNVANAEIAVVYDKTKSKKESASVDPYSQYNRGDYVNALNSFEARLKGSPSDLDALFHKGMCLYHLKRYDEALTILSSVPKKGSKYSDEAMFFIGQTYEQKGDNESAISAYKILVEEKNAFSTKASKRIKILEGR